MSKHTSDSLLNYLDTLGIRTTTHHHPAVYTVEESRALRGDLGGAHCKNLFLKDKKDKLWLAITYEHRPVDLKSLQKVIGSAHLSFGKPELLQQVLGVEPGSVTALAAINDDERRVTFVLDRDLLAEAQLNFHPLVNTASTQISVDDLMKFFRATGHEPLVVAFPEAQARSE